VPDTALASVLKLEIPARPGYVSLVRLVVATAANTRRILANERVDDLALALSEACTNAIEAHTAAGTSDDPVSVEVEESDDRLVVTVADRGSGFDPMELPSHPPVDDPARLNYDRGLGIPIIRNLVDEVTFQSDDSGTVVRMVVLCPPAPEVELDLEIDLDELGDLEAAWDEE
jgi:anti-sigma regulatory factor (Ser/Thr protein kinase)